MHQHLGEIGTMRLILGLLQDELNRANDAVAIVVSRQQQAFCVLNAVCQATPVRPGLGSREGEHEAY
jgi:hypothetical protein